MESIEGFYVTIQASLLYALPLAINSRVGGSQQDTDKPQMMVLAFGSTVKSKPFTRQLPTT